MNYNQNEKIAQITSQTLIIGVDIAKFKHVARAQDYRGIEFGSPCYFDNTKPGFQLFLDWINQLKLEQYMEKVIVGMEPTGHYWLNLAHILKENNIKFVAVNPLHVKKSKELDDNSPTKNDVKDAKVIAQLVKDGRYAEPTIPQLFTSMFWFPKPSTVNPKVEEYLAMEMDYLLGEWNVVKVLLSSLVPLTMYALAYAFWRHSWKYGLLVINLIAILKVLWSLYEGDGSGIAIILPAFIGLVICNLVIWIAYRLVKKRSKVKSTDTNF